MERFAHQRFSGCEALSPVKMIRLFKRSTPITLQGFEVSNHSIRSGTISYGVASANSAKFPVKTVVVFTPSRFAFSSTSNFAFMTSIARPCPVYLTAKSEGTNNWTSVFGIASTK